MDKKEFIEKLKQIRSEISLCLADENKETFVGEFNRLDLEILDRALLIAIEVTDLDLKGR